jgi:beta-lactamase regulating signal transducer with metallopeptidase domain
MNTLLAILGALVNSLWQALAVALLVWLTLRFTPRINAATRYAIWWATLVVVLILPVAPRLIPRLISMTRTHPKTATVTTVKTPATAAPAIIVEPFVVTVAPGRTAIWPIAVLIVWAALLLWRLTQIVRSYVYLRGVKRRATVSRIPLPATTRRADLLISPDIVSPMAVGFLRPAVVLPESLLAELSEPEREHVLLHESAHLAKYDDWSNLAMRLLAGALALHPVAIWILWRIEREREMACDDWVVARIGSARPYAASLARMAELRQARRGEILASGIFGSGSRIGERIEMLLRRGRTFSPRASAIGIIASATV